MVIFKILLMKMYKLLPFLALLLSMGACQDREKEITKEKEVVVEKDTWDEKQAMTDWRNAWNKNDAQSLEAATADDAVLFLDGKAHRQDSVSAWIQSSASWMKDLSTTSVMKNRGKNFAYEAGTYTHASRENDTMRGSGTYTVIWERTGKENDWSIKLMDITPQMERDTTAMTSQER
jgi:ketosteroid isomerase-like protein